jgi:outer membrane protein OmpA-like peptidoglycan-associated protein/tetratricopeptide (TPR) repeat protein
MRTLIIYVSLLFTALILACPPTSAQELSKGKIKKFVKKGRKAYRKDEYWKAKSFYEKVTDANTDKAVYWFEAGLNQYDSKVKREDAITYFEQALTLSQKDTIPELLYYTAKTYHFIGEFEKAIIFYNIFLDKLAENKAGNATRNDVIREIEICNNGIDLRDVQLYEVENLLNAGPEINSEYPEYAPVSVQNNDLLLFCSRRPNDNRKNMDGEYYEDIFFSTKNGEKWSQSQLIDKSSGYISKEVNEGKEHSAPVSLSADGQTLYIYKRNGIWKSSKDAEGKWAIPIRMNQNVNIGDANPSIFITPDETEMFIVSTGVADSYGERDLYYSTKDESGNWKKPVNMGAKINTPYKEDAPYLSKDGTSLYFASEGHNSMGGFDIYRSVRDQDGNWGEPMNIGTPVNSAGDDIYYVENEDGTLAYYASMRPGSYGHLDIYTAKYECQNIPTTEVKGYAIYAENHLPISGIVKITNTDTQEEMGTFTIDPKTGKYQLLLPPDNHYKVELVVAQSQYTADRPFTDNFYLPKQCVAYNLFQQVKVENIKDEAGKVKGQKATFTHAYFDIDKKVRDVFKIDNFAYMNPEFVYDSGIIGNLAHNEVNDATNVEVALIDKEDKVVRITKTDDNGDFAFEKVNTDEEYKIMVNENDAKESFKNVPNTTEEDFNIQGVVYNTKASADDSTKALNTPEVEVKEDVVLYLGNDEHEVTDVVKTDEKGEFEFKNENTTPIAEVEAINDASDIEVDLDISDAEIVYSALITTLDGEGSGVGEYTENIDIIEFKEIVASEVGLKEFSNILFDFDKFFLREKSKDVLGALNAFLDENPSVQVRLDGHTDWFGTEEYNEVLSKKRALAAHKYLVDNGISPDRIDNLWFGENKPVVANANGDGTDNPENRQLNRRVEIKVEIPEMADLYLSL